MPLPQSVAQEYSQRVELCEITKARFLRNRAFAVFIHNYSVSRTRRITSA